MLEVKELKKLSLRLEVKDNTSAGEVSGETIVTNFFNFSHFSNFKTLLIFSNFFNF